MASTAISAVAALISGVAVVQGTTTASGDTCTITGPSAGPLDFSTLVIRATVATAGTILTLNAGGYSDKDIGNFAVTVATGSTVYIGGKDFDSARFKNLTGQSIIIATTSRFAGSVPSVVFEAVQAPYSHTA